MSFDSNHFHFEKTKFLDLAFALGGRWANVQESWEAKLGRLGWDTGRDSIQMLIHSWIHPESFGSLS